MTGTSCNLWSVLRCMQEMGYFEGRDKTRGGALEAKLGWDKRRGEEL